MRARRNCGARHTGWKMESFHRSPPAAKFFLYDRFQMDETFRPGKTKSSQTIETEATPNETRMQNYGSGDKMLFGTPGKIFFRLSGILWIFTNKTILSITTTIVSSNQFSLSIELYMTAKQTWLTLRGRWLMRYWYCHLAVTLSFICLKMPIIPSFAMQKTGIVNNIG